MLGPSVPSMDDGAVGDGPRSYVWIDAVFRGAVLVDQLVADLRAGRAEAGKAGGESGPL